MTNCERPGCKREKLLIKNRDFGDLFICPATEEEHLRAEVAWLNEQNAANQKRVDELEESRAKLRKSLDIYQVADVKAADEMRELYKLTDQLKYERTALRSERDALKAKVEELEDLVTRKDRMISAKDKFNAHFAQWQLALREANDLLRSAAQITKRDGVSTNWEAFGKRLASALKIQHGLLHPEMYPPFTEEAPNDL